MVRPTIAALIVLVPLTLGVRSAGHAERVINQERLAADAASALADDGWSARVWRHHLVGPLVDGARANCRILVHFAPPEGTTDGKFQIVARPIGPVTYSFRGGSSRDFPRLAPMLAWHLQRYAWSVGLAIPTAPLIAVARSPECGGESPDLTRLRQHLQIAYDKD